MATALEIAKLVQGDLHGDKDLIINGAYDLIPGKELHVSFLNNGLSPELLSTTLSDLIITSDKEISKDIDKAIIVVQNPKFSFFKIVKDLFNLDINNIRIGICSTANISNKAILDKDVSIGSNVIIEENSKIQSGVSIGPNSYIGKNTIIGKDSIIHPNVTIYNNIEIGKNVIINSGSVLGANGFGVISNNDSLIQVPHIGTVIIEDNVVLGAGCTVDRATMTSTRIGSGSKIDGQVHIAHNVKIGTNCIIAGQSAIGGSSQLGDNVILGGQVGVIDNLVIGDNCKVAAKSAVMKSLDKNIIVSGIPAIDHRKKKRLDVLVSRLPELFKK